MYIYLYLFTCFTLVQKSNKIIYYFKHFINVLLRNANHFHLSAPQECLQSYFVNFLCQNIKGTF